MGILKRLSVYLLGRGEPDASKVLFGDGWWRVPSASGGPATQIQESSGPTTLTIGAIADGEFAKRVGATLVGAVAGGGGAPATASYVVIGLDGSLSAERKLTAGTGISLTDGGANGNVTIASTVTGGGNSVTVDVNFGSSFTHYAEKVVTGATWVAADSEIVATLRPSAGDEIDALLHGFSVAITDLVPGDGFTVRVFAAVEAKGIYPFSIVGV